MRPPCKAVAGSVWCLPGSLVLRVLFWERQAAMTAAVGPEYAGMVIGECVLSNRSGKVVNHEALAGAPRLFLQDNHHLVVESDPVSLLVPVIGRRAIVGCRVFSGR